jgi:hypothetical protein
MAGAAQGDCAERDARGGRCDPAITSGSGYGAFSSPCRRRWRGVAPGRRARRRRDRARPRRLRAPQERWADSDGERGRERVSAATLGWLRKNEVSALDRNEYRSTKVSSEAKSRR